MVKSEMHITFEHLPHPKHRIHILCKKRFVRGDHTRDGVAADLDQDFVFVAKMHVERGRRHANFIRDFPDRRAFITVFHENTLGRGQDLSASKVPVSLRFAARPNRNLRQD